MFDFKNFPIKLSGKTVNYICPKCKYKFEAPIEAVLEFVSDDTLPYVKCAKCNFDKCAPLDYTSKRGYHHIYKEK